MALPPVQDPVDLHRYAQINPFLERKKEETDLQRAFAVVDRIPVVSTLVNLVLLGIAAGYSIHDRIFGAPAAAEASSLRRYVLEVKTGTDYAVGLTPFAGLAAFAVHSVRGVHPVPLDVDGRLQGVARDATYENGMENGNCDHIRQEGTGLFHLDGVGHNKSEVAITEHPMVDAFAAEWAGWVERIDFRAPHALSNFIQGAENRIQRFRKDCIQPLMQDRHRRNLLYREGPMQQHLTFLAAEEFEQAQFDELRQKVDLAELGRRLGWMEAEAPPADPAGALRHAQLIQVYTALRNDDFGAFQEPWQALSVQHRAHRAAPPAQQHLTRLVENAMKALVECFAAEHQGRLQQGLALFEFPDQMTVERFNALRQEFDLQSVLRRAQRMEQGGELGEREQQWIALHHAFHEGNYENFMAAYGPLAQAYIAYRATPPAQRAPLASIQQEISRFLELSTQKPAEDRAASAFAVTQPVPVGEGYIFFRNFADTCLMILSPAEGFERIELNEQGSINPASVRVNWVAESDIGLEADGTVDHGLHLIGPFPKGAIAVSFTDGLGEFLTKEEISARVMSGLTQGGGAVLQALKVEIQAHQAGAELEAERFMASKAQNVPCKRLDLLDPSNHDDISIGITYLPTTSGHSPLAGA